MYRQGVEPSNNLVERDIRPAVIWRKTSFFTWSLRGDRFMERMLSFVGTLRKQNRNVFQSLLHTIHNHRAGLVTQPLFA